MSTSPAGFFVIAGFDSLGQQARESTGMFGNRMAIYYIMPQFIQNHSRFVMLMKTCMIS